MMEKNYSISGMTCSGCAGVVQKVLSGVEGVDQVTVSLEEQEATVSSSAEIPQEKLEAALEKTPYRLSGGKASVE